MNLLIITGNLTKEPQLRHTQDGKPVLGFTLANNQGFGERQHTEFYACSLWGQRAEKLQPYLRKGSKVTIQGEHRTERREHEGKVYFDNRVFVREIELPPKSDQASGYAQAKGGTAPPAQFDEESEIPF